MNTLSKIMTITLMILLTFCIEFNVTPVMADSSQNEFYVKNADGNYEKQNDRILTLIEHPTEVYTEIVQSETSSENITTKSEVGTEKMSKKKSLKKSVKSVSETKKSNDESTTKTTVVQANKVVSPSTGYESNVVRYLMIAIMLVTVSVFVYIYTYERRKKHEIE